MKSKETRSLESYSDRALSQGYGLCLAKISVQDDNPVVIESPPGRVRSPKESFLSLPYAKPMEEIYEFWALIVAIIALVGTLIVGILQLLLDFGILKAS